MSAEPTRKPQLKLQRPKGTQDIFGDEIRRWQHVESTARQLFHGAGYVEIRTPALEYTELFARGVGEGTDIVHKEMYSFEKGDRSLTLRPEGTAGVVRAFVEQGLSRWPKPVKLYYMGPMFRYERPQAGRQRQFHQIGLELFGLDTPESDAEAILTAMRLFETLGLPGLSLELNNIGTPAEREDFKQGLRAQVAPYIETLCEDCRTRYETNPLRMLDCKVESCNAVYNRPEIQAFVSADFTGEDSRVHYARLTEILEWAGISYKRNPRLVRGLDYYTKTVFEITSTHLGAQNAVCGGGRYNDLVELLGGPPTPGVGWALGMERLVSLLPGDINPAGVDCYLITDQPAQAFRLAEALRAKGVVVQVDLSGKNFGKQFAQADKSGARFALILGQTEAEAGQLQVKALRTGKQWTLEQAQLLSEGLALLEKLEKA